MLLFVLVQTLFSQPAWEFKNIKDMIPSDPKVTIGKMDNGMVYYIRENKKPEKRAQLMIVVRAGSVDEDDDQNGLAHFCEHMAFNGTKHFPKQNLVNYLETVGIRFGEDLNAFTNQDQTVYMIALPTDKPELIDSCLLVLEDWAHNVSYENEEIDKERGVILEEWRLGKGADDRIEKKQRPIIYYNSKYALRDVIGDTSVLINAPHETFRKFYRDWYRPNLMAVIAVGDFDKNAMEKKIKEQFGKLKNPDVIRPKQDYPLPYHKDVKVTIATDKELQMPMVTIFMKHDPKERGTYEEYRNNFISTLATNMLNQRYAEITRKPGGPFSQFAVAQESEFVGKSRIFFFIASGKGDKIGDCASALLQEAFRVKQHGFTPTELERSKEESMRYLENAYNERDKSESQQYAMEFMRNFLKNESMPGIEVELELAKKFLPGITIEEVNDYIKKMVRDDNTVIAVSAPERPDVVLPKESDLLASFNNMKNQKLEPYVDNAITTPLLDKELTPTAIVKEAKIAELDVTELTLANGVKVVLKPTNFKNDEIQFTSFSPGGTSQYNKEDFQSARAASSIISLSGIGAFDKTQLDKYLAGKVVTVSPGIGELTEAVNGSSSVKDAETMFQLIYLSFTKPRLDMQAFNTYIEKMKNQIKDASNNPEAIFNDSVTAVTNTYNFRRMPVTEKDVDNIDMMKAYEIYKDRFADASDFTFFFVGNFEVEKFKPLIAKYLGNLPTVKRVEKLKDIGVTFPKGNIVKKVNKGIEKKSSVMMIMNGSYEFTPYNNFLFRALMSILDIRLREDLREDKGGVYGVGAWEETEKFPKGRYAVNVAFGCNPDRVEELTGQVVKQIDTMKTKLPEDKYMVKVKELLTRAYEVNLKENDYWLRKLQYAYFNNTDPKAMLELKKWIDELKPEDIKKAANKYLNTKNLLKCVLYPGK